MVTIKARLRVMFLQSLKSKDGPTFYACLDHEDSEFLLSATDEP